MKVCKEKRETVCPDYPKMCRLCGAYRELTNADRIRAMTDEELAEFLIGVYIQDWFDHPNDIHDWLQQPVKEGADHE